MRLVRALQMKRGFQVDCVKFSKDGIHLAVGLESQVTTIYDIRIGQKSWLVCIFNPELC